MCCIVLDATHVFVCRSIVGASVDALAGVLVREILPEITVPSLVYLLVIPMPLLAVATSVPTTVVVMRWPPTVVDGRAATTMRTRSW